MIIRDCAGGVVFNLNKVFLLKNEKNEWVLPKGKIRGEQLPPETAIQRVKYETGIDAKIVSPAGETAYEFFSRTRNQAVYNKIIWYIMEACDLEYRVNFDEGFKEGNFFEIDEALNLITYSQDKSLVSLSYKRYLEYKEYEKNLLYA
ncbi:NUDIX hydrolase [Paratissierella segnis]|jgi:8-oxo-dGTP pyrophosphatase MutT (NUDIX family)|uniref:NUDIX hydrolase n=1 Tax=Paratissierella segnis TaxID=2763679 RepID=A0A926EVF6_9FIRM|nr:NUDIX hydrolase [Paratissierella segnis]MBC8587034.1 NUDIX hydrolase [Paratissierella segnis]